MKKLPLMAVVAAVLAAALWQAPGARAESPGTKRLLWVSLGGVQVIDGRAMTWADYRCDERYRYARWEAWLELAGARFWFRPDCDGYMHVFSSQAPVPDDSSVFAEIHVRLLDSSYNPYPGDLVAQDAATYFSDGSGLIADAGIGYARVDDRGRLEVSFRYECALGLHVPVEGDADWAFVEAYQSRKQQVWSASEPIGDRVVCDGTRHRIVMPLQGYRVSDGSPAHPRPTLPIQVHTLLYVVDSADPREVSGQADRRVTVLP